MFNFENNSHFSVLSKLNSRRRGRLRWRQRMRKAEAAMCSYSSELELGEIHGVKVLGILVSACDLLAFLSFFELSFPNFFSALLCSSWCSVLSSGAGAVVVNNLPKMVCRATHQMDAAAIRKHRNTEECRQRVCGTCRAACGRTWNKQMPD